MHRGRVDRMLLIKNLAFKYPGSSKLIFEDVNFQLKEGEILSIIGPNGAGKSTLLNCMVRLLEPLTGYVLMDGKDIRDESQKWLAQNISYVGQMNGRNISITVEDYLLTGRNPYLSFGSVPGAHDYERVYEEANRFDILPLLDKKFENLSGGQKQIVKIARSVVQETRIILMDEPLNHLDYGNQYKLLKIIKLLGEMGKTIILTTHVFDCIVFLGNKVGVLDRDGKFSLGEFTKMVTKDKLEEMYQVPFEEIFVSSLKDKVYRIAWEETLND